MALVQVGRVLEMADPPFWLVEGFGLADSEASAFLLDFWASGNAASSVRSYGYGLLRWFRHLAIEGVPWERATRDTVRDFVLSCKQPSALCSRALAPRTINHNLAVVSTFYMFELGLGRGPLVNPVPERRGQVGRLAAHHNPEHAFRQDRRADFRQRPPTTTPRSIPDERIEALFALLDHPRDKALVEFYLSSAARPSELLGLTCADVDPGCQQVTVVRKGTRARQAIPASPTAFKWLRLYQGTLPADLLTPGSPLWWTLRRPLRPLNYDAARALLRRVGDQLKAPVRLHDFRHTAAAKMAQDPSLTLADIQRVLGHLNLATTQDYIRQHDTDVMARMAEHLRQRENPAQAAPPQQLRYDHDDLSELMGDSAW